MLGVLTSHNRCAWCHGWIFGCCLGYCFGRVLFKACCLGYCFRKPVDNKKEELHTNLVPANLGHEAKPLLVEPVLIVK